MKASPRPEKTTPNIQIENIEKYKEKDKQHRGNKKQNTRKKKHWEKQINMMTRIKGIEKETKKQ